jgi:hypothetical protein
MARKQGIVLDENTQPCALCDQNLPHTSFRRRAGSAEYMPWCNECRSLPESNALAASLIGKGGLLDRRVMEYLIERKKRESWVTGRFVLMDFRRFIPLPVFCPALGIKLNYHNVFWQMGLRAGDKKEAEIWGSSPSLDRIRNEDDYEDHNVVIVSSRVNTIKNNANTAELSKILDFYEGLEIPL